MRSLLNRDVPLRAALIVLALVLFASVVTGREAPSTAALPAPTASRPAAPGTAADPAVDLDLERLRRGRNEKPIADLFAPRRVAPPQAAPLMGGGGPAAPTAPPLPFLYLGKVIDGGRISVFLARGGDSYSVESGQMIGDHYRVEQVTDNAVTFTYLPLGTRQVLTVPSIN